MLCPIQVSVAAAQMQLRDLVCNASMLGQFLTVDGGEAAMNDLQTQLCELPADVLREAERLFLSQLDFTKFFTVRISGRGKPKSPNSKFSLLVYVKSYSECVCVCPSCQRDRLMANAGDLRVISEAVTTVSQELAVLIDDVRTHMMFHFCVC